VDNGVVLAWFALSLKADMCGATGNVR